MSDFVDGLRAELVSAAEREQARRMPRVSRPAPRLILVTAVAAAMLAIVVLAASGLRTEPDRSATPKPEPTPGGRPLFGGSLEEGVRYRTRAFVPALSFVATGPRWASEDASRPDLLALRWDRTGRGVAANPLLGFVTFVRLPEVYDPGVKGLDASRATAPADLHEWLRAHPDLRVGDAEPVTVAGVPGERFRVGVRFDRPAHGDPFCRQRYLLTCTFLAPNLSLFRTEQLRITILQTEPDPLVILVSPVIAALPASESFDDLPQRLRELEKEAAPLLDTLRIGVR